MTTETQAAIPQRNLAYTIGRNTIAGFVANGVQIGTRLITVPVVIHYLGLDGYGIWNIVMMTAMYMRFGSVGVKTAFQKYVAEATGNHDYQRASRLLSTGCATMLGLSIIGLVPTALLSRQIAIWTGVPPRFVESSAGSISLLALIMVVANVGAVYEAIVTGGHRIDLARKLTTVLSIAEAIAIVAALRLGFGLIAMSAVMSASEFILIVGCRVASTRVVPQIQVSFRNIDAKVLPELIRFAGSYQLVNVLEVLYSWLMPLIVLRTFGPTEAGVLAVITRVTSSVAMLQDAFLAPTLSGGTMVFASAKPDRMRSFIYKSFKVTLLLSILPYAVTAAYGNLIAFAWTGQSTPLFRPGFLFLSMRGVFTSLSLLALVLYRISGKTLLDNIRQVIRIGLIGLIGLFAHQLSFIGLTAGLALIEFAGLAFMMYALVQTYNPLPIKNIVWEGLKLSGAALCIVGAGALASQIPMPASRNDRLVSIVKLIEISLGCVAVAWPALSRAGYIPPAGAKVVLGGLLGRKPAGAISAGDPSAAGAQ